MATAQCPACGLALQVADDAAGRSFTCFRCGAPLAALAGGQVALQATPPPTVNPFADGSPAEFYAPGAFHPGFMPQTMVREQALAKVRGPAITLIVYGIVWGLMGLLLPLALLAEEVADDEALPAMIAVGAGVALVAGAATVFAGARLLALRSYGLVMASIVVNLVIGFLLCPLLAVGVIWPLVVMLDGQVKRHFAASVR